MAKYKIKDGVGIIPEGTTKIEESAFEDCTELRSIVIPDSVTEIGRSAFKGCMGLTSIDIPDSVTVIESSAFKGCTGLTSIVIPSSVTRIGGHLGTAAFAFFGCTGLTSVVVSEGNKVYDSRNNCNAIIDTEREALMYGCQNTVIPDSVTGIGWSAFLGCTGLTSIDIPDSVTEIGEAAFGDCTSLKSIVIPDSVTKIGLDAFLGCTSLTSIVVSEGNKVYDSRDNCNAIIHTESNALICGCQNTIIPDSVTEIGNCAFQGCTGLTSIVIPNSVTRIGYEVFEGCTGLTEEGVKTDENGKTFHMVLVEVDQDYINEYVVHKAELVDDDMIKYYIYVNFFVVADWGDADEWSALLTKTVKRDVIDRDCYADERAMRYYFVNKLSRADFIALMNEGKQPDVPELEDEKTIYIEGYKEYFTALGFEVEEIGDDYGKEELDETTEKPPIINNPDELPF